MSSNISTQQQQIEINKQQIEVQAKSIISIKEEFSKMYVLEKEVNFFKEKVKSKIKKIKVQVNNDSNLIRMLSKGMST